MPACCHLVHDTCTDPAATPDALVLDGTATPMSLTRTTDGRDAVAEGLLVWFVGVLVAVALAAMVLGAVSMDELGQALGGLAGLAG